MVRIDYTERDSFGNDVMSVSVDNEVASVAIKEMEEVLEARRKYIASQTGTMKIENTTAIISK